MVVIAVAVLKGDKLGRRAVRWRHHGDGGTRTKGIAVTGGSGRRVEVGAVGGVASWGWERR